ncbi:hypothetical protein NOF04DRAFT_1307028 [Fusarium oxysporum II5]|nr:hypothetical protein NOF04DRAFT_1307028 [Fusarium oxysporum II5]
MAVGFVLSFIIIASSESNSTYNTWLFSLLRSDLANKLSIQCNQSRLLSHELLLLLSRRDSYLYPGHRRLFFSN